MNDITLTSADYTEIRRRGVALHTKIFKKLSNDDIKTCGKHLGVWQHKTLALATEQEVDMFTDYAIYGYRPHGFNMAEKYLRLFSKGADDFELALLQHMRLAYYAIYQITETNGTDTLKAVDIFNKTPYLLIDHQMAKTAHQGLILAGHLVDFDDFSIQTGSTVLVTREILQADEVARVIDQIDDDQLADFLAVPANGSKLARAVVSATLRLRQTGNVRHQSI